jgi:hypothetical protein
MTTNVTGWLRSVSVNAFDAAIEDPKISLHDVATLGLRGGS